MKDREKAFTIVLTAAVSMALGAGMMYYKNYDSIRFAAKYPLVLETQDYMKDSEIGLPDNKDDSAQINSFLGLYGDKYTFYTGKASEEADKVAENINKSPTGYGCGFEVAFTEEDELYFSDVVPGMPAYEQGLRTGDVILSIDGVPVEKYSDANELKGKQDTKVTLEILRGDKKQTVTLTRVSNSAKSAGVESEMVGDTLWLKYAHVGEISGAYFDEAIFENDYKSIIVDLRNNPGGEALVGTAAADHFVNYAEVKLKHYDGSTTLYTTSDGIDVDVPIVLLVNEKTASAAEIFTALVKQYAGDVTIVGTTTLGKGIFQCFGTFHGGSVQYTAGEFTVGDWPCWQGVGIAPDIEVKMDPSLIGTDEDVQLQKALELLG